MSYYMKNEIKIIQIDYCFPFGIRFQLLRIPRGFLLTPQYWWLFAIQIDSNKSYFTLCIFGLIFEWKRKETK